MSFQHGFLTIIAHLFPDLGRTVVRFYWVSEWLPCYFYSKIQYIVQKAFQCNILFNWSMLAHLFLRLVTSRLPYFLNLFSNVMSHPSFITLKQSFQFYSYLNYLRIMSTFLSGSVQLFIDNAFCYIFKLVLVSLKHSCIGGKKRTLLKSFDVWNFHASIRSLDQ